jgi:hypothetical protein
MSKSMVIMTVAALLVLTGLIYAFNGRDRIRDHVVVVPSSPHVTVSTARTYSPTAAGTRSAPLAVGATRTSTAREIDSAAAVAPLLPSVAGGTLAPPTSAPGYQILDDHGNSITLDQLRDSPQPVTLYLTRGATQVPIRLETNPGVSIADRVAAMTATNAMQQQGNTATTGQQGTAPAPAESRPTAMEPVAIGPTGGENALAVGAQQPSVSVIPGPATMESAVPDRNTGDIVQSNRAPVDTPSVSSTFNPLVVPTTVPGVFSVTGPGRDMLSFNRGIPFSYVQTYDANGNLGWYRMDYAYGTNGTFVPLGLNFMNPMAFSPQQSFAGNRGDSSLAVDQIQQGQFAGQRAALSDAASRATITVR